MFGHLGVEREGGGQQATEQSLIVLFLDSYVSYELQGLGFHQIPIGGILELYWEYIGIIEKKMVN